MTTGGAFAITGRDGDARGGRAVSGASQPNAVVLNVNWPPFGMVWTIVFGTKEIGPPMGNGVIRIFSAVTPLLLLTVSVMPRPFGAPGLQVRFSTSTAQLDSLQIVRSQSIASPTGLQFMMLRLSVICT